MTLTAPPYLSPSSVTTFQQCPLKYKYSKIDGLVEPPTVHTLLGNFVHEILEEVYSRPAEERTVEYARSIARNRWHDKYSAETKSLNLNERDFRWRSWWCVENLWSIEDPSSTDLAGIEYEINGSVNDVMIKGYVDRFRRLDDGSLIVEDYKTGKVPQPKYTDDKFQQLFIYATMLAELEVGSCSKVSLMYLAEPTVFERPVTSDAIKRTIAVLTETRQKIDKFCEAEDFPAKPSKLCDWCHFKKICPAWKKH